MLKYRDRLLCPNCFAELEPGQTTCPACGYIDSTEAPFPIALPVGTVLLGKYSIGKVLGKGGFGITYLAYDMHNSRTVAIKEYLPDTLIHRNTGDTLVSTYSGDKGEAFQTGAEKFYEEAKTIARFNGHPNIIHVSEFFYENNTAYFVMEYIRGVDLKTYIADRGGRLSEAATLRLFFPLLDALEAVHGVGVLHRDISPDNIFITEDGTVKLLDFGSARQVLGEQSKSLSVVLKPGFAPVEQYQTRGKQGPWTDLYALAATAYYCLTGKVPESAMDRVEEDTLLPPSKAGAEVSPELEAVLMTALSVRAVGRYQTVEELKEAVGFPAPSVQNERQPAEPSPIFEQEIMAEPRTPANDRSVFTLLTGNLRKLIPKTKKAWAALLCAFVILMSGVGFGIWKAASKTEFPVGTRGPDTIWQGKSSSVSNPGNSGGESGDSASGGTTASPDTSAAGGEASDGTSTVSSVSSQTSPSPGQTSPGGPTTSQPSQTPPVPSADCTLKSLTVSGYSLSPEFSRDCTEYNITVFTTVKRISVSAAANDSSATLKVSGAGIDRDLTISSDAYDNVVSVAVTAPSGARKIYKIYVSTGENRYSITPYNNPDTSLSLCFYYMTYVGSDLVCTVRVYNNYPSPYNRSFTLDYVSIESVLSGNAQIAQKTSPETYSVNIPSGSYTDISVRFTGNQVISHDANLLYASVKRNSWSY